MLRRAVQPVLRRVSLNSHVYGAIPVARTFVDDKLLKGLSLSQLTEIQRSAHNVIQANDHVVIKSPIGTGKTLSYLLPALHVVRNAMVAEADIERPGFRLLVLTNSRERASEIAEMANKISDIWGEQNLQARVVIGGTSYQKEIDFLDFKEPEVIVATPGRLLQHLPNSDYFRNLKVLVVDNAEYFTTTDQTQLDAILKDLSKNRKTIIVGDERLTTDVEPKWFGLETASENVKIVESKSRPNRQTKHFVSKSDSVKDALEKALSLASENKHKKVAVFFTYGALADFASKLYADNQLFTTSFTPSQAPGVRMGSFKFFAKESNGILLTTNASEESLKDDLDLVINVGRPDSEYSITARNSRLKDGGVMVTIAEPHLDLNATVEVKGDNMDIKATPATLQDKRKDLLQNAYEMMMSKLKLRGVDAEKNVTTATELLSSYNVEPKPTYIKFAHSVGVKDVLLQKNLLSAKRIEQDYTEQIEARQRVRLQAESNRKAEIRARKVQQDPEELKAKLRALEEEQKKVQSSIHEAEQRHHDSSTL